MHGEKTVLVVEDEGFSRRHVVTIVGKTSGCSVLEAVDGSQALHLLSSESIDLMILDLHLPDAAGVELVSGLDLLHQLRAGDLTAPADLPVIVVTGTEDVVAERIARAMGVHSFLYKPVKADTLRQAVAMVLDGA
ncbi:response regulator [Telmatospirillum sp.]|uniref:response regulator n=1 Tax=Telmatospirillum sp. TaxID=2079197 RepID=UPI002844E4F3|nr:response regulator [Telmatospirillum sp.]MDR3438245.1 response regulator [Telmatospirillum sp.]